MGIGSLVHIPATQHNNDNAVRDDIEEREISSLSVDGEHSVGLATFNTEAMYATVVDKGAPSWSSLPVVDEYQDVKRYFERPRLIGTVPATNTVTNLSYLECNNPLTSYWPAAAVQRLNGVFGYRCAIKFTVTLAATPFQQGMVVAAFQYGAGDTSQINVARHRYPALVTNLPHARLNFQDQTMCELTVPYVSPFEFFELGNTVAAGGDNLASTYTYGTFSLTQTIPYIALAVADPVLKIYLSLHDMELYGAVPVTLNTVIPQSGLGQRSVSKMHDVPKEQQKEKKKLGGAISGIGKAATVGCLLGSMACAAGEDPKGAAKYAQSAMAVHATTKIAEEMGYSKPVNNNLNQKVIASETPHEWNIDMPSNATTIAPFQANEMLLDGRNFGSDVDEMDLDFVLRSYSQCFLGSVSTSDVGGTVLYATNLCPTSLWYRNKPLARPGGNLAMPVSATLTTNAFLPTTLCYVSQMFKYWRGSIKFRFTFAKTRFHAGRLIAAYVPATVDTVATGVLSNQVPVPEIASGLVQPFQYSEIFDLRDNSVFEFTVPYVASRDFISTLGTSGGVTLSVLDNLITTGESSSLVPYLVEVCAGDDFQLANYIGSGLGPCCTSGTNALVVYQSGLDSKQEVDPSVEAYTSGERFTSVKQLAMIPYSIFSSYPASSNTNTSLPPFYYGPTFVAAVPMPNNTSAYAACAVGNVIARMYAFCSGSTVYGAYMNSSGGVACSIQQSIYDRNNLTPTASDTRNKTGAHKPKVIKTGYNASIVARAPSYQKYPLIPCNSVSWATPYSPGTTPINGSIYAPSAYRLEVSNNSTLAGSLIITHAAADDARFMGYIGPPPCWLLQSTQTANLDASAYGQWN